MSPPIVSSRDSGDSDPEEVLPLLSETVPSTGQPGELHALPFEFRVFAEASSTTTATQTSSPVSQIHARLKNDAFWHHTQNSGIQAQDLATQPSVFDDPNPEVRERYRPKSDWENSHRFDPTFRWTWDEEHRVIKKLDWKIMLFIACMFMGLELDRSNISQALTDNFLEDLALTTNDYNLGNTLFKLSFLCAELPSQLIAKRLGPDVWIPSQVTAWSIVGILQFRLGGRTSFLVTRALLGMLQGGFIPQVILYLSCFYKHRELSVRLSYFWGASAIAEVLGGVLASLVLQTRRINDQAGWRWLFFTDGFITLIIGLLAFFLLPSGPTSTKGWLRGARGWFNVREEKIIVNRVLRDDPNKSSMHNREALSLYDLLKGLGDFDLWPLYLLGLTFSIPMATPALYMTLTLRSVGFTTIQTNFLAVPSKILHLLTMLALTRLAEKWKEYSLSAAVGQIWALPCLFFLNVVNLTAVSPWLVWLVLTFLIAWPDAQPLQVNWTSRNASNVQARAISAALYNMAVQSSGMIAANIYQDEDKPQYSKGNRLLFVIALFNILLYLGARAYYKHRNRSRSKAWDIMNQQTRSSYLATTMDAGNKTLDFRFAY